MFRGRFSTFVPTALSLVLLAAGRSENGTSFDMSTRGAMFDLLCSVVAAILAYGVFHFTESVPIAALALVVMVIVFVCIVSRKKAGERQ